MSGQQNPIESGSADAWTPNVLFSGSHFGSSCRLEDLPVVYLTEDLNSNGWMKTKIETEEVAFGLHGIILLGQIACTDGVNIYPVDNEFFRLLKHGDQTVLAHVQRSKDLNAKLYNLESSDDYSVKSLFSPVVGRIHPYDVFEMMFDQEMRSYISDLVSRGEIDFFNIEIDMWEVCRIMLKRNEGHKITDWIKYVLPVTEKCKFCDERLDLITDVIVKTEKYIVTMRDNGELTDVSRVLKFPKKIRTEEVGHRVLAIYFLKEHTLNVNKMSKYLNGILDKDVFPSMHINKCKSGHQHISLYEPETTTLTTGRGNVKLHNLIIEDMVTMVNLIKRLASSIRTGKVCALKSPMNMKMPFKPFIRLIQDNSKRFRILNRLYALWHVISMRCSLPVALVDYLAKLDRVSDEDVWQWITKQDNLDLCCDDLVDFTAQSMMGKLENRLGIPASLPLLDEIGVEIMGKMYPSHYVVLSRHPKGIKYIRRKKDDEEESIVTRNERIQNPSKKAYSIDFNFDLEAQENKFPVEDEL